MFGSTKMVIEAQARHIERLERMVSVLFNALMVAAKTPIPPSLNLEEPKVVNMDGVYEPDPGTLFDPEQFRRP